MSPRPAYGDDDVTVAFIDDTTMVFGVDRDAMATVIGGYQSGSGSGLKADLKEIMAPHAERVLHGGAVLPLPLRQMVSDFDSEDGPNWAGDLTAGAIGIDLTDVLAFRLHLRFANAEAAQQALADAKVGIAEAQDGMREGMQGEPMMAAAMTPIMDMLDKLQMTAEGSDFRVSLDLTKEEMQGLQGVIMMPMMMASQAAAQAAATQGGN